MTSLDSLVKKPTPAQQRERLQWVLDTVRENQFDVWRILHGLNSMFYPDDMNLKRAIRVFQSMQKHDRDALLISGGILTDEQIEVLK